MCTGRSHNRTLSSSAPWAGGNLRLLYLGVGQQIYSKQSRNRDGNYKNMVEILLRPAATATAEMWRGNINSQMHSFPLFVCSASAVFHCKCGETTTMTTPTRGSVVGASYRASLRPNAYLMSCDTISDRAPVLLFLGCVRVHSNTWKREFQACMSSFYS